MKLPVLLAAALFTVGPLCAQTVLIKPYVQPGDGATLDGTDVKVIAWLTEQKPGDFTVEYAIKGAPMRTAKPERVQLDFNPPKPKPTTPAPATTPKPEIPTTLEGVQAGVIKEASPVIPEREQHYFKYSAILTGLPFDSEITYRVRQGTNVIRQDTFKTRASATKPIRFVAVGDLANGKDSQNRVAFQIAQQKPDFLVALGDIVYSSGRVSQYMHHFWTTYNDVPKPSATTGAPLMASIPFYPVIGNHDADVARLPETPDALGAFYFFSAPLNGPGLGAWSTPLGKDAAVAATFREKAGTAFPALSNYSFDSGPAHFLCLDANGYATKQIEALKPWIEKDLAGSKQRWKFVCFHHPAFHTSKEHFTQQSMRLLEPIFEANGVDVVFAGHVHNYQRTRPLRFTPTDAKPDPRGRVNGTYQLDEKFDGDKVTKPDGIVHIVSGGGGATLYKIDMVKTIAQLQKDNPGNWVDFTAKHISDRHSFSVVDLTPDEFILRQLATDGTEIDRIRITK